jgi:M6 family metalloprotease-like protein
MRLRTWLAIVAATSVILSGQNSANAADPIGSCKLQQPNSENHFRMGWPKDKGTLRSTGSPRILVLAVDFSDFPQQNLNSAELRKKMELDKVQEFFSVASNKAFNPVIEIFPNYVRMPDNSLHYGKELEVDEVVNGEWESHHMTHDAIEVVSQSLKISDFDAAIVVISEGPLSGRVAFATSQDEGIDVHESGEIHNTILAGLDAFSIADVQPWTVLVHEINHLLGAADLYLYAPEGWWQGKSSGPFGLQGNLRGKESSDYVGWNAWLRGWIPDSRVYCVNSVRNIENIKLVPPGSKNSGYHLIVIKKSDSEVFVVEALKNKGYSSSTYPNSVLVYNVDILTKPGFGPMTIIPKITPTTTAPFSPALPDWERFLEAPLRPGDQVFSQGVLFRNANYARGALTFSLFTGSSANQQRNVKAKKIECKVGRKTIIVTGYKPTCSK